MTAGALRAFDRDELQAVVAHEFSHILNGDMALNTRFVASVASASWDHPARAPAAAQCAREA
ncbi:MAG: M48 family metalloprotease [Steroidobacteraceae bacterium]